MSDDRLRALIKAGLDNERDNPAVAADVQYRPHEWTQEQEQELVARIHGTEAQRIDRLIAEQNEEMRRR